MMVLIEWILHQKVQIKLKNYLVNLFKSLYVSKNNGMDFHDHQTFPYSYFYKTISKYSQSLFLNLFQNHIFLIVQYIYQVFLQFLSSLTDISKMTNINFKINNLNYLTQMVIYKSILLR